MKPVRRSLVEMYESFRRPGKTFEGFIGSGRHFLIRVGSKVLRCSVKGKI
jgi:hypothetical protein